MTAGARAGGHLAAAAVGVTGANAAAMSARPTARGSRLVAPSGAAVDSRGRIYVSDHSVRSRGGGGAGGELVRLDP